MSQRHWTGHVYYYVASLVGLGLLVAGLVTTSTGLLKAALPRSAPEFAYAKEEQFFRVEPKSGKPAETPTPAERRENERNAESRITREGVFSAAQGGFLVIIGAPIFVWHIRRARERERS